MTPKEKADELYDKMYGKTPVRDLIIQIEEDKQYAKQCALVAVDELIKIHYLLTTTHDTSPSINYWKEVKQELEKL
jgi:hypothetical protein